MIFFGSGSYNKRDSEYRLDICEGCGHMGQLHSYTTTRAGHLYWIPVIPLGSKRILEQCPNCNGAREMNLGAWKKLRKNDVIPAVEAVRIEPSNREVAEKALSLTSTFGTEEEFKEVLTLLTPLYSNDPEMLKQMGWGMNRFQQTDEAQALLQASLAQSEDASTRELADFHRDAPKPPVPRPPSKIGQLLPLLILPAILLTIAGFTIVGGLSKDPSHVYLVNGQEYPYSVSVNGKPVEVAGNSAKKLNVNYGNLTVEPAPGQSYPFPFEPINETLSADFWDRLGGGQTIVINPDSTALVEWEEIIYFPDSISVATEEMMEGGASLLYTADPFFTISKADYIFKRAPQNIEMSGNRVTKTQITLHGSLSPVERANALFQSEEPEQVERFITAQLHAAPEKQAGVLLPVLGSLMPPEKMLAFVEDRIKNESDLVEWHRYYQSFKPTINPEADMLAEYEARLKSDPTSATLTYLRARLMPDGPEQIAQFQKSTELSPQSAYGHFALAYNDWVTGDFPAAGKRITKAVELKPDVVAFESLQGEIRSALGQWEEAERDAQTAFNADVTDFNSAETLISAMALLGKSDADIDRVKKKLFKGEPGSFAIPDEIKQQWNTYLDVQIAQSRKDTEAFKKSAKMMGGPIWNFYINMMNEAEAAANANLIEIEESEEPNVELESRLILYSSALINGNDSLAAKQEKKIRSEFGEVSPDLIAELFDVQSPSAIEDLHNLSLDSSSRRVVSLAIAARHLKTAGVSDYLDYAELMNYMPSFPQTVVTTLIKKARAAN